MNDREINPLCGENFKHIEDIIDSRKLLGQYNIQRNLNTHGRYAYSQPRSLKEYIQRYDDSLIATEGDSNIKRSDSEITIVRVKFSESTLKRRRSKWDMHDIAVPGDGSHLGESPSLVNLVTLVGETIPCEGEEYLVPLSSWDPYVKFEESNCRSESNLSEKTLNEDVLNETTDVTDTTSESVISRSPSLAGKISNFIKKHISSKETNTTNTDSTKN